MAGQSEEDKMWIDSTSYRRGENRVPTMFTAATGQLAITVTCGHRDYKGEWVMHCEALHINAEPLGAHCKTASQAKREAISIVCRTLSSLSESVKEIVLATD